MYNNYEQNKIICLFLFILRHSIRKDHEVNNNISNIICQNLWLVLWSLTQKSDYSYAYNASLGIYEHININYTYSNHIIVWIHNNKQWFHIFHAFE